MEIRLCCPDTAEAHCELMRPSVTLPDPVLASPTATSRVNHGGATAGLAESEAGEAWRPGL